MIPPRPPGMVPTWRQKVGLNRARMAGGATGAHRFAIGIFEAAIVSDGPLTLPEPDRIFRGVDAGAIRIALDAAFVPAGPVRVAQNCVLLDIGGHLVLFDNGMGTSTNFGGESGRLERSLAALGLTPANIDSMVLSHAHQDHCWGTMRDDGTPAFPNAQIWIAEEELSFWETFPDQERVTVRGVRRHLLPLRERIFFYRDGEEFLPGIHALRAPGHTPGHTVFVIASGDQEVVIAGDIAFHHPLSFAHPTAQSAFDLDPAEGAATRTHLLGRIADERMRMIGYHQPWPGIGYVAHAANGFRFVPEGTMIG